MLKKLLEFFESTYATVIGGVFLLSSLVLSGFDVQVPWYINPCWVAIIFSGTPLLCYAVEMLIHGKGVGKITSALLISIAMISSVAIGDLFAAGEIAFIMAIGEILEDKTTQRAKKGLKKLVALAPTQGRRISNGKEEMICAQDIEKGDILRILPGETIPVDGEITGGETSVDQSVLTGESMPVDKGVGDSVFGGTINRFGAIDICASRVGEDSSLQRLILMAQEAENKKAPIQRIADKWASYLVPIALLLAIVAGLIKQDIIVAVTMLVVFCPCALVLATPTAIMAAIGQATKHGVIVKSGEALENMGKADIIAFDKTGTLTYGRPEVSDIVCFDDSISEKDLLSLAASAECKSEHPLGKAITASAERENLVLSEAEDFRMTAGRGIYAQIAAKRLFCGNEKFLKENGFVITDNAQSRIEELRSQGKALVLIGEGNNLLGVIALSDVLKPDADNIINRLREMESDVVLLTGDNRKTADYFAQKMGISDVFAELLPEEKVHCIEDLQAKGKTVCMIGDGVNDAPALKTAQVSVAMAAMGSDIAVEAADIALMGDDVAKIPYLKRLSIATRRTIKLSIFLSLFINFLAIILSFFELLNPTTGALVHNAGSCFVVFLAALLYDRKFE